MHIYLPNTLKKCIKCTYNSQSFKGVLHYIKCGGLLREKTLLTGILLYMNPNLSNQSESLNKSDWFTILV